MQVRAAVSFSLIVASVGLATPAAAIYRIDTFAGRGYGDGGFAIAAAVIKPADAVTDAAGNVYFSDQGNQLVRRVDAATGMITTVAGNGSPGSAGDGGPALLANLHDPDGLALDPAEQHLYIVEYSGIRVRRVDLATGTITTFAGTGDEAAHGTDTGDGGPAISARFNQPVGVAVNAAGDVFISERDENPLGSPFDEHRPRIRRVDHATGIITLFAGGRPEPTFNGDGHPALETTFADPIGLQFDGSGNLYVGELGNHRVRKIAAAAPHIVSTVAGQGSFNEGSQPFSGDGGPATSADLERPVRFALVPRGCGGPSGPSCTLYVGDSQHHCVRKVDTSGIITTVVNAPANSTTVPIAGDSGDGGSALSARLTTPAALRGPNDTILIVDDDDHVNRIRLYDPVGGTIRAFAGTGEGGFGGDLGPATRALLNRPTGLDVDGSGNVFVTEHNNFRIRRVAADANRTITTFAGTGERGASGNGGPAGAATFDQPTGITLTPAGDFLIADARTQTVRRIDHASGFIQAFAGQPYSEGADGDNGPATAARLNTPLRTAVGPGGDVFVADFNNNRIRRVDGSGTITTFATGLNNPAGLAFGADGLLYVSDFGRERIVALDPAGAIQPVAGTGTRTGSIDGEGGNPSDDRGDGGPAGAATFSDPTGLSFDDDGALLVTDQGNNVIRRIALDTSGKISPASIVTTIVGDGRPTFGGDGGNALAGSLNRPTEAVALGGGRILIADRGNQRVRIATSVQNLCDVSCDDGDPCTADTCDPIMGCKHVPASDTDRDGVCDPVDNCPTVPNPNQNADACGNQPPGGGGPSPGACAAGDPTCIPGQGPVPMECLVETVVKGARGTPVVRCTDGDPACDANPAPGHCGFAIRWCFNNADPRLPCAATGVRRVQVQVAMKPRATARALVSEAVSAVAQAAGGAARGPAVVFPSPLTTANLCTSTMIADVSVRGRAGRLKPGKALVSVTAKRIGRGRDVDRLRLECLPAS